MVTNKQVRKLFQLLLDDRSIIRAARLTDMDEKTARKYRDLGKLPSEVAKPHDWATRSNPFAAVWDEVRELLDSNPGLQAKTIFAELRRRHPGRFADNQLRTLQRHIKTWRATSGPPKEVFFTQVHEPGRLGASDFTSMNELNVTIQGQRFDHLVYHFVLTYSNWETATICFSESFESLSEGLQNALWKLGAVPERHRTDRMGLAVNNASDQKEFTQRYQSLMAHCGLTPEKIQANHGNENGDIEQRHHRFKQAVDQALMLRGSREFVSRNDYDLFLKRLLDQLNSGRRERLTEELAKLRPLPARRLEACKRISARVDSGSLIHIDRNVYSVPSRLIGEKVDVRLYVEHVEVWYAQQLVARMPRLRGRDKDDVNYRHIIDWLVRKPGSGKTHLLCALAQDLVHKGRRVRFFMCSLLVQGLLAAKRDLKLSRLLKRLANYEVLLIDDLGYVQQNREEMEVLFTLLADRYERGSVWLTSNLPFSKWEAIFKDPMTTAAAIDRLVHHSVIVELNLPSYRLEHAAKAKEEAVPA